MPHEKGYTKEPVTFEEVAKAAYDAGFRQPELEKAIGIAWAESGLIDKNRKPEYTSKMDAHAFNTNHDGSHDRGPWQINDKAHADITPGQAYDVNKAAKAAWDLSGQGKNWKPWKASFGTKNYKDALPQARQAANEAEVANGRHHVDFHCWCGTDHGAHQAYEFDCRVAIVCWCGEKHCYKGH